MFSLIKAPAGLAYASPAGGRADVERERGAKEREQRAK
jgi:hypothetical protein